MITRYSDHAANERTFLAWVRTAIAMMAFGFVIAGPSQRYTEKQRFEKRLLRSGSGFGERVKRTGQCGDCALNVMASPVTFREPTGIII
jgi:hypothetical protein